MSMTSTAIVPTDKAGLERLEGIIVRHLERFAFREPLAVAWVC